jgi:hypothetical protein
MDRFHAKTQRRQRRKEEQKGIKATHLRHLLHSSLRLCHLSPLRETDSR